MRKLAPVRQVMPNLSWFIMIRLLWITKIYLEYIFRLRSDTGKRSGSGYWNVQYRSIIFIQIMKKKNWRKIIFPSWKVPGKYSRPISVEVKELVKFYPAEKYHENYIVHNPDNPYVFRESIPRIKRSQSQIPELIKPGKNISDK